MLKFKITIDGHEYFGLYPSSFAAWDDALERFPEATRVTVQGAN